MRITVKKNAKQTTTTTEKRPFRVRTQVRAGECPLEALAHLGDSVPDRPIEAGGSIRA